MEVVRLVDCVLKKVENVRNMIKEDKKLGVDLINGLQSVKCDMSLMSAKVKISSQKAEKPEEWILQLQDLAYDIEDFIEVRGRDRQKSAPVRLLHVAMVTDPRPEHIARIDHFKERIKTIQGSWPKDESPPTTPPTTTSTITQQQQAAGGSSRHGQQQQHTVAASTSGEASGSSTFACATPGEDEHLGTGKSEILELLGVGGDDGHQKKLKVVSILGCSGSGKSRLARAVHEDESVVERFPRRAFVDAASLCNDAPRILDEILKQVRRGAVQYQNISRTDLTRELQDYLRDKRYLVIIDGVQAPQDWSDIEAAFPNNEEGSRIVVSTNIQSVANACSRGSYLYKMRGLGRKESEDLFWAKLGRKDRPPVLEDGLETLFGKCEGLPEALVRTAEFLSQLTGAALTDGKCRDMGVALGTHLAGDHPAFRGLKRALVQCYDSLDDHGHKTCMLSVSMFPRGHRINRKSLVRRWKAEGLLVGDVHHSEHDVALGCLDRLTDLGVIEPVLLGDNCKVKRYRVHGVMLEFIVHRSVSWNFITLIHDGRVVRNYTTACDPRRLSVHGVRSEQEIRTMELSRIRSLTICHSNEMNFGTCKLLRVLDLEGCAWLHDAHLHTICGLLYLKYLSIRSTQVGRLPKEMKHLHCLETLDARDTRVELLPMEVLMLPQLLHLFGEFELPVELADAKRQHKIKAFFSEKSRLQTLAGFKVVNNRGFQQIIRHCGALTKVKIWCKVPPHPPARTPISKFASYFKANKRIPSLEESLVSSLQARFTRLDSLSVDFGGLCKDFLGSLLKAPSTLTSIKVRGEMKSLPDSSTLEMLRNLRELHLSQTGLSCQVLSGLQHLDCLVCLKLAEDRDEGLWEGNFLVEPDKFRSLQRMCFHGPKLPHVEIRCGGMRSVISLQLICPEPENRLGVTGITHLQHLNEVMLHPDASEEKLQAWKKAANEHENRPYVKKQPIGDL